MTAVVERGCGGGGRSGLAAPSPAALVTGAAPVPAGASPEGGREARRGEGEEAALPLWFLKPERWVVAELAAKLVEKFVIARKAVKSHDAAKAGGIIFVYRYQLLSAEQLTEDGSDSSPSPFCLSLAPPPFFPGNTKQRTLSQPR